ncbi:MAG: ribosome assembly RNA-binding protein YhbY [Lachnospira sp.]|nr:ribosome assembly RNA-binding protein YhbY [Lachnospira sp.]
MTSKQRSYLKSLAMTMEPIFQLGKNSLTPEFTEAVSQALEARELIKINVLQNCADDPNALAQMLAERTRSQVVQVIGKKIVLYKESKDNKKIQLPPAKKQ